MGGGRAPNAGSPVLVREPLAAVRLQPPATTAAPYFATLLGRHQATELGDALTHRQVLVVAVIRVEVVYLDSQEPVIAGLQQQSHDLAQVDQPLADGGAGKEEPCRRGYVGAHLQVFYVSGEHVLRQLLHRGHGVVQEPQEIPRVEVHAKVGRPDRFHQPEHLLGGVVTMVFSSKPDPPTAGLTSRLLEPASQHVEPWLAWLVTPVGGPGTRGHPHYLGTYQVGVTDLGHKVFQGGAVGAVLEPGWVAPGVDAVQADSRPAVPSTHGTMMLSMLGKKHDSSDTPSTPSSTAKARKSSIVIGLPGEGCSS